MIAPYRLPSERTDADWAAIWAARQEKIRLRDAALAYRRENILRLLHGDDLPPPPPGVAPDYRRWARDLCRDLDRLRDGSDWVQAAHRRYPARLAYWRALRDATGHQRIRLRRIAAGRCQP